MMTAQLNHTRHSLVNQMRKQLRSANAPLSAQGYINTLDMQLGKYIKANPEDKAALRPAIEQIITRIERAARDGREGNAQNG